MSTNKGEQVKYRVKNFEKYNDRHEVKKPSWFRLENSFIHDPKFAFFTTTQRMVWIAVLCLRSEKNVDLIDVDPKYLGKVLNIKTSLATKCLAKLIEIDLIEIELEPDQIPTRTRPDTDQNPTRYRPEPDQNPEKTFDDRAEQIDSNNFNELSYIGGNAREDFPSTGQDNTGQDNTNTTTNTSSVYEPSRVEPNPENSFVVLKNWTALNLTFLKMLDSTCTRKWAEKISEDSSLDCEAAQDSIDRFIFDCATKSIDDSIENPIGVLSTALKSDGYRSFNKRFSKDEFKSVKLAFLQNQMAKESDARDAATNV